MNEKTYNELTSQIINACIEVHRELGPGLLESVYEVCLLDELYRRGLRAEAQVKLPVSYKGKLLNKEFVIDILVEDLILLELKAIEVLLPIHEVQLVTYLKLSGKKLGLLINFHVELLKNGVRRKINGNLNE
ncbi:MAG: GxxExxY protein [Saprospiraceae bacterium]|nr:GxxExxY protein [Saprospiraceae bacterium]